jgi:phosphonate transport system substrate-binding protein
MIAHLNSRMNFGLSLGLLLFLFWGHASSALAAEPYVFGVVPQYDQRHLFATWKPLLDMLQELSGLSFHLDMAAGIPAFEKEYNKGRYDFLYLNPYHLLRANKDRGYLPILRGRGHLNGVLVVRKDSPLQDVSELEGKVVAFPSPNALGASLLMRADLSRMYGLNISSLYVNTHDSVYLHVVKGLTDAGGGVEQTLNQQRKEVREALRILYVTRDIPSHPIAVHPRLPKSDVRRMCSAFLELAGTGKGQELLSKIPMNQPVATSLNDYVVISDWGLDSLWVEE